MSFADLVSFVLRLKAHFGVGGVKTGLEACEAWRVCGVLGDAWLVWVLGRSSLPHLWVRASVEDIFRIWSPACFVLHAPR